MPSCVRAATITQSAVCAVEHHRLEPVEHPAPARAARPGCARARPGRRGRAPRARRCRWSHRPRGRAAGGRARAPRGGRGADRRRQERAGQRDPAHLLEHDHRVDQPETEPAGRLGHQQRRPAELAERLPHLLDGGVVAVDHGPDAGRRGPWPPSTSRTLARSASWSAEKVKSIGGRSSRRRRERPGPDVTRMLYSADGLRLHAPRTRRSGPSCAAWLDANLPAVPRRLGAARRAEATRRRSRASIARRPAARTGSAGSTRAAGRPSTGRRSGAGARPRRCRTSSTPRRWPGCARPGIYNANGIWQIGPMIMQWGTEEQQQQWLPGILVGRRALVPGLQRARGRLRPRQPAHAPRSSTATSTWSTARRSGSRRRTSPSGACSCCAPTRPPSTGARKHEGITAFIIDMETPGIECRPIRDITGDDDVQRGVLHRRPHPGRAPARRRGRRAGRWRWARSATSGSAPPGSSITHGGRPADDHLAGPQREPRRPARPRAPRPHRPGVHRDRAHPAAQLPGAHQDPQGPAELARGAAGQAAVVAHLADSRRAGRRPARAGRAARHGAVPTPSTAASGPGTTRGSATRRSAPGATEIQKNIIAKKAIKLARAR